MKLGIIPKSGIVAILTMKIIYANGSSELIIEGYIYVTAPYTVGEIFYTKKPGIAKVNFVSLN